MELYNLEQNIKKLNTSEQQTFHLLTFNNFQPLPNLPLFFPGYKQKCLVANF